MEIQLSMWQLYELLFAVRKEADRIGMPPKTLLTIMAYETAGTLDPWKKGPKTQWGRHIGLIQMGEPQRQRYGYTKDSSISEKVKSSADYLVDRGWLPGMSEVDAYSIVNAGRPGLENRTDENNGGAPGTVAEKVGGETWRTYSRQMSDLLERVGPTRALSEFADKTEDQLAYENLRVGPTFGDIGETLPEKFDTLEKARANMFKIPDLTAWPDAPRPKPDRSGLPGGMITGHSLKDMSVPLVAPDFEDDERLLDPRLLDTSKVPVPSPKPQRDRAMKGANPFDLETSDLKQQARLIEENPVLAKRMIRAAGRDPELFGFA